jgi:hypothetical protein
MFQLHIIQIKMPGADIIEADKAQPRSDTSNEINNTGQMAINRSIVDIY